MDASPMDVALDIETTGLDPFVDRIVTVALVSTFGDDVTVFDEPEDEAKLLIHLEKHMRKHRVEALVTWNGSEFDLPYLAVRFALNGIDMGPFVKPTGVLGKYGRPRYEGHWYGCYYVDIAYDHEKEAKDAGVKWSLKSFAEYKKMGPGLVVDFEVDVVAPDGSTHKQTILDLNEDERKLYCTSDAQLVMALWREASGPVPGQAVFLDGGISIL